MLAFDIRIRYTIVFKRPSSAKGAFKRPSYAKVENQPKWFKKAIAVANEGMGSLKLFTVAQCSEVMCEIQAEVNTYKDGNDVWCVATHLEPGVYIGKMAPYSGWQDSDIAVGKISNPKWISTIEAFKSHIHKSPGVLFREPVTFL